MNLLEKICLGFVWTVIVGLVLVSIGTALWLLWKMSPFVAIIVVLFNAAVIYLTRNSNIIPK